MYNFIELMLVMWDDLKYADIPKPEVDFGEPL